MIGSIYWYLRKSVFVRWGELLKASELWISIAFALSMLLLADRGYIKPNIKVHDLAGALLTYASIAFGFCLTGSALALTIPDRAFAARMATTTVNGKPCDTYSNLIFVFSWASLAHLVLVIVSMIAIFFYANSDVLLPGLLHWKRSAFAGGYLFLSAYAVSKFIVTVITLSQVGDVYIDDLKKAQQKLKGGGGMVDKTAR